jgi:hypothetical protein
LGLGNARTPVRGTLSLKWSFRAIITAYAPESVGWGEMLGSSLAADTRI